MKALVYHGRNDVRHESVADPRVAAGEVLLKVKYAGLCHTDINEYRHGPLFVAKSPHPRTGRCMPIVLGHEFSGEVIEVGAEVSNIKVGDRVAVNAVDFCGECAYCKTRAVNLCSSVAFIGFGRDGGFAELASVPARCCFHLSPSLSYRAGALVEPFSVALHAVKRVGVVIGSRVAVIGGGAVGLCVLQALRATGAGQVMVIDTSPSKEVFAKRMGATSFLDPSVDDFEVLVREITAGGVDVAFECVGSEGSLHTAFSVTRAGGTICLVGIFPTPIEFDFNIPVMREHSVICSLGYTDEFPAVINMLSDGRLQAEPLITRILALAESVDLGIRRYQEPGVTNVRTLISMES